MTLLETSKQFKNQLFIKISQQIDHLTYICCKLNENTINTDITENLLQFIQPINLESLSKNSQLIIVQNNNIEKINVNLFFKNINELKFNNAITVAALRKNDEKNSYFIENIYTFAQIKILLNELFNESNIKLIEPLSLKKQPLDKNLKLIKLENTKLVNEFADIFINEIITLIIDNYYINTYKDEDNISNISKKSLKLLSPDEFFESSSDITTDVESINLSKDNYLIETANIYNKNVTENLIFNKTNIFETNKVIVFMPRNFYTNCNHISLNDRIFNEQINQTLEFENNYISANNAKIFIIESLFEKGYKMSFINIIITFK